MPLTLEECNGGWCAKCGDGRRRKNSAYCRVCANEYSNAWKKRRYHADPEARRKVRSDSLKRHYGITEEQYTELWSQQGGVCAICLLESENRELSVDHCHDTGQVRGLLCEKCNTGIGQLQHSAYLIDRAKEYVA